MSFFLFTPPPHVLQMCHKSNTKLVNALPTDQYHYCKQYLQKSSAPLGNVLGFQDHLTVHVGILNL